MKLTGYEYECKALMEQALVDWKQATDLDPIDPDTAEICAAKLRRLEQAEKLFADARDTAYFIRNGIYQDEAIADILNRIKQFQCPHEHTSTYLMGQAPDNFWEEEHCHDCGAIVYSDAYMLPECVRVER